MKYSGLLLALGLLALVKGEEVKSVKTIPTKTTTIATTTSNPGKTLPPQDVWDLPLSDLAKKYCDGVNVTVKFDGEDFICENHGYVDKSGCAYRIVGERTYTSFSDECYEGRMVEEGIYLSTIVRHNSECVKKYEHMKSYTFGEKDSSYWKRDLAASNGLVDPDDYSSAKSVSELPVSDLAKRYCIGADNITVFVKDTDFLCVLQNESQLNVGCLIGGKQLPIMLPKLIYSSFNNECINANEILPGLYKANLASNSRCEDELRDMKSYYIRGDRSTKSIPTSTTTKTVPTSTTTTKTTKTVPTSTTTTKTIPTSTTTTKTTKTVPTSTTTTKTIPTKTTTIATTTSNPGKTLPPSRWDLPISDLAKKYCDGVSVTVKYDGENFICEDHGYVNKSRCPYTIVGAKTYTSFSDECYEGKMVEEGIYLSTIIHNNSECEKKYKHMRTYTFGLIEMLNELKSCERSTKSISTSTTTTKTKTTTTVQTSTTTTKTIPTSTTTTKTVPTSTTTTKTIPTSTTTTKTVPTSTKCIPVTKTVTEKETITKKETVTVTVYSTPTNVVDDKNCASKYAQCGGVGFNGPTCCQSGSTCHEVNKYYSQCI